MSELIVKRTVVQSVDKGEGRLITITTANPFDVWYFYAKFSYSCFGNFSWGLRHGYKQPLANTGLFKNVLKDTIRGIVKEMLWELQPSKLEVLASSQGDHKRIAYYHGMADLAPFFHHVYLSKTGIGFILEK